MKIALYELYKALKSKVLLILFVALFLLNLALSAHIRLSLAYPMNVFVKLTRYIYLHRKRKSCLSQRVLQTNI